MLQKQIEGVIVPLVTPYNLQDLPHLIDHVINGGISNIFILGTTGEALKLKQKQKIEIIEKASIHISKRVNLLVGISSFSLEDTFELMKISHDLKATSVIAPLVLGDAKNTIEALLQKPYGNIILYNNPKITKERSIRLDDIKPFASEKRVLGIKDSSNDFTYLNDLIKIKKDHFKIYFGGENLKEAFTRKIDGIVPGDANVDPKLFTLLWKMREKGPWDNLKNLKKEISLENENYLQALKSVLKKRNLISSSLLF
jgi:4-hydroxy-tetrahydrodipicolinate synthase